MLSLLAFTLLLACLGCAVALLVQMRRLQWSVAELKSNIASRDDNQNLAAMVGKVGTWTLDSKTERITWSDEVYKIHSRPKHIGPPTLEQALGFYHHEDRQIVADMVEKALQNGSGFEFRARVITEHDTIRTVLGRGICQFDRRGNVKGVFGAFIDITDTEPQNRAQCADIIELAQRRSVPS